MKVNEIYEFKKTKNRYRIAGFGQMKAPGDGKWIDSVIYESFQEFKEGDYFPAEPKVYVRESKEFEEKFERSIPAVQIFDSQTGQMLYNFGMSEATLAKYFDGGFGGRKHVKYTDGEGKPDLPTFCQILAGDILIGNMKEADDRITPELLDSLRKDIKAGVFKKSSEGLAHIQNLLYFLSIPDESEKDAPKAEGESDGEMAPEEVVGVLNEGSTEDDDIQ